MANRKVHFEKEEVWEYSVGRQIVSIMTPQRKWHKIHIMDMKGINRTAFEELLEINDVHITPKEVKDYIIKNLRST